MTTSAPRSRPRASVEPREPCLSDSFMSVCAASQAGATPKTTPVRTLSRKRKNQHGGVEMNAARARQICRCEREQGIESPARDEQAGRAAAEREEHAFGQQLPNESKTARPERGANRKLAMPRGRAGEEEIGDVRAGDEEHAADRAEQRVEHDPHIAHAVVRASA